MKSIVAIFFLFLFFSCQSRENKKNDYEIMSVILNHELGNKSDIENGQGWIDTVKKYNSVLILNTTNLSKFDNMVIKEHLDFHQIKNFPLRSLNKKQKIDLNKIKDYDRYELLNLCDESNHKESIGDVIFSSISYTDNYNKAIIFVKYICGGHCGFGKLYYLKKNEKWLIDKEKEIYVS